MKKELNVANTAQPNQTAASERAQDHVQHDRLQSIIAELAAFGGRVGTPIQPFDAGAIAQMESCHRIQRLAIGQTLNQIVRRPLKEQLPHRGFFRERRRIVGQLQHLGGGHLR